MRIKEDLINKEVLDGGAELIGKVVDVVMDKDTFEVTDLVIKKTGIADQIKAGGENVVPSELVKVIGDKILLKSDGEAVLRSTPTEFTQSSTTPFKASSILAFGISC